MKLKVKKLHPDAILPTRGSERAIGLDLYANEDFTLNGTYNEICPWVTVPTGIAVEIPRGYYGRIAPRSGLAANHGVTVLAGVIDSDYRGEVSVCLASHCATRIHFDKGDRIAQLILERADIFDVEEVAELGESERGSGGFGSSGK